MAYLAGTSTDVVDLVNDFATFIEANGWIRDDLSNEGTGRRYHAHRGSQYLNMRAYLNEDPSSEIADNGGAGTYSVAFNIGTGYSGATAWHRQAGTPTRSGQWITSGASLMTGAITAYHFFAHNSGDQIFAVIEYASGKYQWIGFGLMTKYGTFTGGDFMFGSNSGVLTAFDSQTAFGAPYGSSASSNAVPISSTGNGPSALVTVSVDAETGWHEAAHMSNSSESKRRVVDINNFVHLASPFALNSVNSVAAFLPIKLYVTRSAFSGNVSVFSPSSLSPLGEIPMIYKCWIENYVPSQQVTFGSDNYRVFPWCGKGASFTDQAGSSTRTSGYYGFAIKE